MALTIVLLTKLGIEDIFEASTAVETARKVNDEIHKISQLVHTRPDFVPWAVCPCKILLQQPPRLSGRSKSGYSNIGDTNNVQYLDEPQCEPFWAKMEFDVLVYLHPRIPPPNQMRIYQGYEFLAANTWGSGVKTAMHVIRLMISGLFDKHLRLKIILGHCGDGIPFSLKRIDHRIRHFQPHNIKCKLRLQQYWDRKFWITTARVMDGGAFADTLRMCGEVRLMWSVDYPYEDYDEIGQWLDQLEMNENTRAKIGWKNAKKLLKLN